MLKLVVLLHQFRGITEKGISLQSHNHHIHFTQLISTFKGKRFDELPNTSILEEKNGDKIIGFKYWPIMSFDILKRYTKGAVSDYSLQHHMMDFYGSQISISETTGKIEDKK